ncbi:M24 family metallopeptidase [Marinicella sp. S1101]|uniref:M24 family metallopeptidase n=1 Tax=Marinicella marina TaxID=2996016 RepID=UPI002260F16E|nr:M24 family metallopeptidase [Marinicella marina]MCX7552603.1 M24 family metallopeptidase [Marinicella marina]MDJ1139479.1 M24 family metallopeptidase [Marinicella marina]
MQKLVIITALLLSQICAADSPNILSLQQQAKVVDRLLEDKIKTVLPQLMRDNEIDMWIVMAREYNEDPVIRTLLPATWHAARRRTVLVMFDPGEGAEIEALAVARYDVGAVFKKAWDKEQQPDQWARLAEVIAERKPKKIALNLSQHYGQADGLTHTEYQSFVASIPKKYQKRIVSAETLAVNWLEIRTPAEMAIYPQVVNIAHHIIAEGLSEQAIQPGVTSTEDLVWWFRERIKALKLDTWFHPSVSIQRADAEQFEHLRTFDSRPAENIIQPGDLVHVDFGITYLRMNTDTQQHAYVLRAGETEAPEYLKQALVNGNRLQDIFTNNFKVGRTGNEVLAMSRQQAIDEGIKPSIYTHPIGYYGHAAGTTLGMWDSQGGVPHTGDHPLHANTAYAIELNAATYIKEWDKEIRIMLEEDAFFDGETVRYINGRQKHFHLIPRQDQTHVLGD